MERSKRRGFGTHAAFAKGVKFVGFDSNAFLAVFVWVEGYFDSAHGFTEVADAVMCLKAHIRP